MYVDSQEDEIFGRIQSLSQIGQQCANKTKVLYLVGMDRIGKTLIAKATFNNVKHLYKGYVLLNALKVVVIMKRKLWYSKKNKVILKPRNLKETQYLLKIIKKNKNLLIFHNIKNQSQIENIVSMDTIFASFGSTLIVTTWDWKVLDHLPIETCNINIKELDEEVNSKLFIAQSCKNKEKLFNELLEIRKKTF